MCGGEGAIPPPATFPMDRIPWRIFNYQGESWVAGAPRGLQNRCVELGASRVGSIPTISVWVCFALSGRIHVKVYN